MDDKKPRRRARAAFKWTAGLGTIGSLIAFGATDPAATVSTLKEAATSNITASAVALWGIKLLLELKNDMVELKGDVVDVKERIIVLENKEPAGQ